MSFRKVCGTAITLGSMLGACQIIPEESSLSQCGAAEQAPERLLLQQVSADGITLKWRGAADAVCVGASADALDTYVAATQEGDYKIARISGLNPDHRYFYSIGAASRAPTGQFFQTAPPKGNTAKDGAIRMWLLGDSGTASDTRNGKNKYAGQAQAVKEAFFRYNREQADNQPIDLMILLGDNAYTAGTDQQWQAGFFDVYPEMLSSVPVYPTIGNHEMGYALVDYCGWYDLPVCAEGPLFHYHGGISQSADPDSFDGDMDGKPDQTGPPYLEIFSLPTRGEVGGVASGTEQYYSVDYGNVHLVSLDSQLTPYDEGQLQAMRDWLVDDLRSNQQDWTVVIFHHPPYSRGMNHDSDYEGAQVSMRETFAPVFESHGVDVIYSGHAHSYERSWYLTGHHGSAASFDPGKHTELNANGDPALGQTDSPYQQISRSSGVDDKAVYTVSGSAGKVTTIKGLAPCKAGQFAGCNTGTWLQHPAHRTFDSSLDGYEPNGIARLGSVVLDITADRLVSRFVDVEGSVLDYFVIEK